MRYLMAIGSLVRDVEPTRELAEKHADVFFAAGLHPHDAKDWSAAARKSLEALLDHPRLLAVGEIGLDYHYHHSSPEQQREAFRDQIRLAIERSLPLVIHTREAHDDTLRILAEEKAEKVGGVFHCFSGSLAMAGFAVSRGFRISFSGMLTFKNAGELREIAATLPQDRILTETDAPFLSPHPHRGKRNEPVRTLEVVQCLAALRGVTAEMMGEETTRNFETTFPRLARSR
jgi:TatD DNase family protein